MDDEFKEEAVLKEEETMEYKDREDLVKSQKSVKKDEHSTSESFVCVQQQTQQVEDQSYPAAPDFQNTLDAKLASIFPTQFAGYFQNMGHPLKSAAHCVQGTMQSVVDHSKGLLQSREVNGGYMVRWRSESSFDKLFLQCIIFIREGYFTGKIERRLKRLYNSISMNSDKQHHKQILETFPTGGRKASWPLTAWSRNRNYIEKPIQAVVFERAEN